MKLGRSNGETCPRDKLEQRYRSTKGDLGCTDESNAAAGMSAAEIVQGGRQVDAMPTVGASPSGGGQVDGASWGSHQKKGGRQAKSTLAYPPWSEEAQSSSLANAGRVLVESVLQQTTGCGGGGGGDGELSGSFKRPWYPSQWEAVQVRKTFGGAEIESWGH